MNFAISRVQSVAMSAMAIAALSISAAVAAPSLKPTGPAPGASVLLPPQVIQPKAPQPNVPLPNGAAPTLTTPAAVLGQVFVNQNNGKVVLGTESKPILSVRVPAGSWLVIARFDAMMSDKLRSNGVVQNAAGGCYLGGGTTYFSNNGLASPDTTQFGTEFLYEPASDNRPTGNQNVHVASVRLPVAMMALLAVPVEQGAPTLNTITLSCGGGPDVSLTDIKLTALATGAVTTP